VTRFRSIFDEVRAEAVQRELQRDLPFAAVQRLAGLGFGALRVPREFGGEGLSLPEFFDLLVDLAAADSNVAHLLRGHFAFVEILLLRAPSAFRDRWLRSIADGAIIGNAASEQTGNSLADMTTTVQEVDGRWVLNGKKFYSTGTLYSSHVYVAAGRETNEGPERVTLVIRTDAPGVTLLDDWNGMGQRLTASGTTVFDNVEVDPESISPYSAGGPSHLGGFFQLVLVAVAAGIGLAVLNDTVDFVRPRTRTFINANADVPRDDPQVKHVIGQLSAAAFTDRAVVLAAAELMQRAAESPERDTSALHELVDAAEIAAYRAQVQVLDDVLRASTLMFEVGGASATFRDTALDRHWRNARTVASHNPVIYKFKQIGDYELNGVGPNDMWRALWSVGPATPSGKPAA
jgi:alkylation response protein AidB-like acyl-CoA dehydrogenase